ncbi:MAG: response regulator, partial [Burkholderiales bacterium]
NLVSNAIKYTVAGEVAVELSREAASEAVAIEGREVMRISVRDTGIGVPEAAKPRLFQAFTQADSSNTRKYGGTGLGLAIVRQLAELMGGRAGFESEQGTGSTFWFTVALEAADPAQAETTITADPRFTPLRILVVEARAAARRTLQSRLEALGPCVRTAEDNDSAIAFLRTAIANGEAIDGIFVDERLRGCMGLALVQRMHADPVINATRAVVLTRSPSRSQALFVEQQQRIDQERVVAFMSTPFRDGDLRQALAKIAAVELQQTPAAAQLVHSPLNARVLLVEDNPVNLQLAHAMLCGLGCAVTIARNGLHAVDAFRAERFDLVLMDCQMPEMDGFAATEIIRAEEAAGDQRARPQRRTPIIALTANALQGDRERCLLAGMDDHLGKPYRKADLRAVMERWRDAQAAHTATA